MNTHDAPVSDGRFVLAFYGVAGASNVAEGFFHTTSQWFSDLRYPPDKLGVGRNGHPGKICDYRQAKMKLKKHGFSDITSFSLFAARPNAMIPAADYFSAASFSHAGDDGGYAIVAVPLCAASREVWLPVASEIIHRVCPAYGIGFTRDLRLGPVMYALGVCQGLGVGLTDGAYEEARNISRWCDMGMVQQVYREGLLRDVYPWNFLTHPQLQRPVGGMSFEQWIRQDRARGTLTPLVENVVLWEVDEPYIPELRRSLHEAGAIFDWRMHQ